MERLFLWTQFVVYSLWFPLRMSLAARFSIRQQTTNHKQQTITLSSLRDVFDKQSFRDRHQRFAKRHLQLRQHKESCRVRQVLVFLD